MAIVDVRELMSPTGDDSIAPDEPPNRQKSLAPWLRSAEYAYAAVLLSVLTGGTVTAFWRGRLQEGGTSLEAVSTYTFLLVQLPAVVLLGRRVSRRHASQPVMWFLGGLVAWLLLSTVWATRQPTTLVAGVSLMISCCVGAYLAISFSWTELAIILFVALQPGLVASRLAIDRRWPGSLDETGNVAGIYGNRNSLGPPAVLAVAMGAILLAVVVSRAWSRRGWRMLPLLAAVWSVALFDLDLQRRSRSATSWVTLFLIVGVVAFVNAIASTEWFSQRPKAKSIVGGTVLATATAAFILAMWFQSRISEFFGRAPGFDHRTDYWRGGLRWFPPKAAHRLGLVLGMGNTQVPSVPPDSNQRSGLVAQCVFRHCVGRRRDRGAARNRVGSRGRTIGVKCDHSSRPGFRTSSRAGRGNRFCVLPGIVLCRESLLDCASRCRFVRIGSPRHVGAS